MLSAAWLSEPPRTQGHANDDRAWASEREGLFAVADGTGPTYGGYHRPIALEIGWEALLDGWQSATGGPQERLVRAVAHANAAMVRAGRGWEARSRDAIVEGRAGELTHPTASMTIVAATTETIVVAQIGSTRGYLLSAEGCEQLLKDQTLATLMARERPEVDIEPFHETLPTRLMGYDLHLHTELRAIDWQRGDWIALCTDGLWRGLTTDAMAGLAASATDAPSLARALLDRARPTGDARTVLVVGHD